MPPISKITAELLREKLEARHGNVAAVAADLELSRNEVYRKMRMFDIDPEEFRMRDITYSADGVSSNETGVTQPQSVSLAVERAAHTFGGMVERATAAAVDIGVEFLGRKRAKSHASTLRLLPEQIQELHAFRREMAATLNTDINDNDVVQWFHRRYFQAAVDEFRRTYQRTAEPEQ